MSNRHLRRGRRYQTALLAVWASSDGNPVRACEAIDLVSSQLAPRWLAKSTQATRWVEVVCAFMDARRERLICEVPEMDGSRLVGLSAMYEITGHGHALFELRQRANL